MFNLGPTRALFIRFVMVVGLQLHSCAVLSCIGGFLKSSKHKCLKKGRVVKFPISFPKFSESWRLFLVMFDRENCDWNYLHLNYARLNTINLELRETAHKYSLCFYFFYASSISWTQIDLAFCSLMNKRIK